MRLLLILLFLTFPSLALSSPPQTFREAKIAGKNYIYYDQNSVGDLYCGCTWQWTGESGGLVDHQSCGYSIRKQANRANRIEWEHIVPASNFGRARQCWQDGGRKNCTENDPVFSLMEADLHNLYPAIGEVNADRSNYNYGMALSLPLQYGQCKSKSDFKNRTFEPRLEVKGMLARVTFYMADRYNLNLSSQQEKVLMAWDRAFPVSPWEIERDRRTAKVMGWNNPFVTRQKVWSENFKPSGEGLKNIHFKNNQRPTNYPLIKTPIVEKQAYKPAPILGNKNSMIYHLYQVCPGYDKISSANQIEFQTENQAKQAGFRKARNCSN